MADRTAPIKPGDRIELNKSNVDRITEAGIYLDTLTTGFRLQVGKGVKTYQVASKVKGRRTPVYYTIGRHGDFTPKQARDKAVQVRLMMKQGINPNELEAAERAKEDAAKAEIEAAKKLKELTLGKVFQDYIAEGLSRGSLRESTVYTYKCDFNKCLGDWLDSPIVDIGEADVEARHAEISKTHRGQANTVMRILRAVLNFAINNTRYQKPNREPIITTNSVSKLSKNKRWNKLGERKGIVKDHQLKAFFEACKQLNHSIASDYFQFLVLTGLRADEAASLPWSQVSLKGRSITILETKNGREHILPLTDYLHALLKQRYQNRNNDFVFGNGQAYMSDFRHHVSRINELCKKSFAASEDEEMQMEAETFTFMCHDLRRTFGTVAAGMLPDYQVKRLLNHANKNDVTQTHYIHAEIESLREPMSRIGQHILNCAGLESYGAVSAPAKSKVVKLRRPIKAVEFK